VVELAAEHQGHKRFPDKLAFMLDNRIRRLLSPPERLISKLGIGSNDVVVDFGCGPGFFLIPIAKIAGRAIGIDVSPHMLERAAQRAKKEDLTIQFLQSDGTDIRLEDGTVNLILLNNVFHEVGDKPGLLGEFRRILTPLGRLAIVERTREVNGLWAKFSPPLIDEKELAHDIQQTGFRLAQPIPYGKSSIVIAQKVALSY
jgi:ubiquinone/menaquinone biosynthesis C-methylase UbiE